MKQFNYKKAWIEMAAPAYEALSPEAVTLIAETIVASAGLSQKADLDMPWPEGLREMFEKVGSLELAKAARTIHQFGHWAPAHESLTLFDVVSHRGERSLASVLSDARRLQATGGYWKFSNYADQVLTERLGIPRVRLSGWRSGVSHVVLEGALRACLATENSWTWEEVGWAVPAGPSATTGFPFYVSPENFEEYVAAFRKACGDGLKEATDISRFMEES